MLGLMIVTLLVFVSILVVAPLFMEIVFIALASIGYPQARTRRSLLYLTHYANL